MSVWNEAFPRGFGNFLFSARSFVESNTVISERVLTVPDTRKASAAASNEPDRRRNFDVDDLVGFCAACPARIYAQDIGVSGCTEDRCINCCRDDRAERSGEDR